VADDGVKKLKIVVSEFVEPGKVFVVDPTAAGDLYESMRPHFDEDGELDRIVIVPTDGLKKRLGGFAKAIGLEVVE